MLKTHRRRQKIVLLRTVSLAAILGMGVISPALAQETQAPTAQPAPQSSTNTTPTTANRQSEPVAPEDILKDITVTGRRSRSLAGGNMIAQREPETTSSVDAHAINQRMALAGPLQIIASVPGVATGQSDPYGLAQRSFIYLRGLPATELGWIVEGVPAVDQAFFLPYSETFVDPENLAGITVIPGSSRITDPVQNGLGGEIVLTARNPADEFGGRVAYSHGSYDANRAFARIDTGELGASGVKAFVSGSYTSGGTFNLPGLSNRIHVDSKIEKDFAGTGKSTLFISYSDWKSVRSNTVSLAQFRADEASGDFTVGNYQPTFVPGLTTNYYKLNIYRRKNILLSWDNEVDINDRLSVHVVPYYHWTRSNSPGQTSINPNSLFNGVNPVQINTAGFLVVNGTIPAMSNSYQNEFDAGVNAYAKYDVTNSNQLLIGYWHDYWHLTAQNNLTPVDAFGNSPNVWAQDPLYSTTGAVIAGLNYKMHTNVDVISIGDQQKLLDDKLTIDIGVRYFRESLSGINLAPGPQANFAATFHRFLPRATISYDVTPNMQVYGNVITSERPPVPINIYPNTYSVATGKIAQLAAVNTPPETAVGEELGYRFHNNIVTADIAVFNKSIKNRQITASAILNGAGVSTTLIAGDETVRGVSAELALAPIFGFSPYVNGQYLDAKTKQNFFNGVDYLPTDGKVVPASPKYTATLGLNYVNGKFFGNVLYRYTSSQFSTLMNDQKMPSYGIIDLGIGYNLPSFMGKDSSIRLNMTNIANKPYLGVLSAATPNAVATKGINGTTFAAATPLYTLSSPRSILVTLALGF